MEKKVALPEPPDVKLPTPRNLSCKVVCSSELLPGDKAVVVILVQDDTILTSILNTLGERKTTALSCDIGWVFSGQLGPIYLVLTDPFSCRAVHIQDLLQALEPKAVFMLGFCHESTQDKYLSGDIFICNEVHTSDGVQACNEGLVKLVKMLKYGWNPPESRNQFVHTGSAQCARNGNNAQIQYTGVVEMHFSSTVAAEVFTLLKNGSIPWTAVCGMLPSKEGEQSFEILQGWNSYTAEVIATFMVKVFETDDIFKVFDPNESESRMKSLRLSAPSQESSIDSQTKTSVTTPETMDAKKDARTERRKPLPPLKYTPHPDDRLAALAPAQVNELRSTVRSEVLDVLSRISDTSRHDSEASAGVIPKKKPIQSAEYDVNWQRQLDFCLPLTTAHDSEQQLSMDANSPNRKQAARMANSCQATGTSSADLANVFPLAESSANPNPECEIPAVEGHGRRPGTSFKGLSNQGVDRVRGPPEVQANSHNSNEKMSSCERSPAIDCNQSEAMAAMGIGTTLRSYVPVETAVHQGNADSVAPSQLGNQVVQHKGFNLAASPTSSPCRSMRPGSVSPGARGKIHSRSNDQSSVYFPAIKKQ